LEPGQRGIRRGYRSSDRLIDLVRNRSRELPHGREAVCMRELGSGLYRCSLSRTASSALLRSVCRVVRSSAFFLRSSNSFMI
jgi:hypothetical protein